MADPLDHQSHLTVTKALEGTRAVITVEEHSTIGGLGSAVSEYLAPKRERPPHLSIGLPDKFVKAGQYQHMLDELGLLGPNIAQSIGSFMHSLDMPISA